MSTSTLDIPISPHLRSVIFKIISLTPAQNNIRMFRVCIDHHCKQFVLASPLAIQRGTWLEDYEPLLVKICSDQQVCFIFVKIDDQQQQLNRWMMLYYCPEGPMFPRLKQCFGFFDYRRNQERLRRLFGRNLVNEEPMKAYSFIDLNLSSVKKWLGQLDKPPLVHLPKNTEKQREKAQRRIRKWLDVLVERQ